MNGIRKASHAGSWYTRSSSELHSELETYLSNSSASPSNTSLKVLIGPHAGYAYSGPTAAWGYKNINPDSYSTVFLLGPSHHAYLEGCHLPCSQSYDTPLGQLPVDREKVESLRKTGKFGELNKKTEEQEHSLEMHLPYIRHVFREKDVKIVPIMVGDVNLGSLNEYGTIFAEFLKSETNLFIISSDFCHWGQNFDFMPYDRSKGAIFEYIELLDRDGMRLIEGHDLNGFYNYIQGTGNTICGCNPIMVAMSTILESGLNLRTQFVRYAQSNQVRNPRDFSVSYASSITTLL